MGFIPAFLMLRNVHIAVMPATISDFYFDNNWYNNSIYPLIVHLLVDI